MSVCFQCAAPASSLQKYMGVILWLQPTVMLLLLLAWVGAVRGGAYGDVVLLLQRGWVCYCCCGQRMYDAVTAVRVGALL